MEFPEIAAADTATRLVHIDSASCWYDPLLEVNEAGLQVVIHKNWSSICRADVRFSPA